VPTLCLKHINQKSENEQQHTDFLSEVLLLLAERLLLPDDEKVALSLLYKDMLPSTQRLSRTDFTHFLGSKDVKSVFNALGTLKYQKSLNLQASIVISSKIEKRAVYRNKLRRRLYSAFSAYSKEFSTGGKYILYISKKAPTMGLPELKTLFYELLQKAAK
jgi:ribonuclease P protein component